MAEAAITVAMEIAIALEFTSRELSAIALELCTATSSEVGAARARTDTRLSTAYRATTCAHATTAHATATSAHAATSHATAGTYLRAAATSGPTTTVVLSQCRTGNCQTERQGRRAQDTEFRH
jgi:hypothetical protein